MSIFTTHCNDSKKLVENLVFKLSKVNLSIEENNFITKKFLEKKYKN